MKRNVSFGFILVKPRYGLAVTLCLCLVTVIVSLYFLEDLTPKVPHVKLKDSLLQNGMPNPEEDADSNGELPLPHPEHVPVLNDIEIEVRNFSKKHNHNQAVTRIIPKQHSQDPKNFSIRKVPHANGTVMQANQHREKYIIYYCRKNITCCGWGDRQHGILSAYVISVVTNRTFGVDMLSPCPLTNLFHPRKLNWKVNKTALQGLSTKYIHTVNDKVFRQFMQQIDFNSVFPQDIVYLTTNYDYFYSVKNNPHYKTIFRKKFKSKPRPVVFADLWQNVFKLNRRVKRRYTAALSNAGPSAKHKLVCAHIRLGRNPTIPNDAEIRNTMETIQPLWDFFEKYKDPNLYKIFVASDSELVREKTNKYFPDQTIDVAGDIIHIDKTRRIVSDPCVGFEKVLADQYLLSSCDVLVLTYSVFGKAAAYMRRSNHNLFYLENGTIQPLKLFNEKSLT